MTARGEEPPRGCFTTVVGDLDLRREGRGDSLSTRRVDEAEPEIVGLRRAMPSMNASAKSFLIHVPSPGDEQPAPPPCEREQQYHRSHRHSDGHRKDHAQIDEASLRDGERKNAALD